MEKQNRPMAEKQTDTLRHAGLDDIPAIIEMAKTLYEGSTYSTMRLDLTRGVAFLEKFIIEGNENFLVMLSHDNGKPVGVIAAHAFTPLFSSEKIAAEVLFWLDPAYRTSDRGKELTLAYEYWAKLIGVSICQYGLLSSADQRLAKFYERNGAVEAERVFYKDIR